MVTGASKSAGDQALDGLAKLGHIRAQLAGERQVHRPLNDALILDALEGLADMLAATFAYAAEAQAAAVAAHEAIVRLAVDGGPEQDPNAKPSASKDEQTSAPESKGKPAKS